MHDTKYLYGQGKDWGDLSYDEALKQKIKLSDNELTKELDRPLDIRDFKRVKDLSDAIDFNTKLLTE